MPDSGGWPAWISVLELSPYHHEVVVAFCNHALSTGINIRLLLPPRGGLGKSLLGIASQSHQDLKELAAANNLAILACKAGDDKELASLITAADSLFIATLPRSAPTTRKGSSGAGSWGILMGLIQHRLVQGRPTAITIHKPHDEIPRLAAVFSTEQLSAISFVALSEATETAIRQLLRHQTCRVLVMPVVSKPASVAASSDRPRRVTLVIPGEISTRRRNYNQLCTLAAALRKVGSDRLQIQVMGRLKRESWLEKLLFLLPLPASLIFLLRHPRLRGLSRQGFLDLSRVQKRKLRDTEFAEVLERCSALLDVQQPHYEQDGITSGLVGLSLTHAKPALKPGELLALLAADNTGDLGLLRRRLLAESAQLEARRQRMTAAFRREIADHRQPAAMPEGDRGPQR